MNDSSTLGRVIDSISRVTDGQADFVGCAEGEVQEIVDANGTFVPDKSYLDFMRRMGRFAGGIFTGTDIFYPQCLEAPVGIREDFPVEIRNKLGNPDDLFFFAHHQGYQYYFFRRYEAAVNICDEGQRSPAYRTLADSFDEFLLSSADGHARLLDRYAKDLRVRINYKMRN